MKDLILKTLSDNGVCARVKDIDGGLLIEKPATREQNAKSPSRTLF